ncbi:MAG: LamG-like jellyroll fold domain-containing protein [Flavobacteriaceae bacterium]|nr:LamG-like jellyroll fold domain-containing protein [Flavobacteriaceae bacterium]
MELKLLTKFVSIFFLLMFFPVLLSAQVVIKNQGFDAAAGDNWNYTPNGFGGGPAIDRATVTTVNTRSVSAPNSLRFGGSNSKNADPNIELDNQSLAGISNVQLSVAYSSDGSPDVDDDLWLDLSFDGGLTYNLANSFKLIDGRNDTSDNVPFGSTVVNITQAANPFVVNISTNFPAATQIKVRIRFDETNNDNRSDFYYIDNIQLAGAQSAEIDVQGFNNSIPDGSTTPSATNGTDFGSTQINLGIVSRIFTILNLGSNTLNLNGTPLVSITGSTDFTVTSQPTTTAISGGSSTTFTVEFAPTSVGAKSAIISINNDDSNENPYNFTVGGAGLQTFIDTDGDGVTNDIDIDDDNDGIPDTIEQDNCAANPVSNIVEEVFINETFGSGTGRTQINANIPSASTTYCYEDGLAGGCLAGNLGTDLNDGEYTVFNSAQIASWAPTYWYKGGDHTGDANGKMALFNAAIEPGEFYRATITGAFPNLPITYDFWAINLDRADAPGIVDRLRPNVLVEFRDLSGNLITAITTGDIAPSSVGSNQPTDWHNFTANITLGNITEFVVIFINNTPGGLGNDLALDDIVIKQTFCNSDNDITPDVFDLDADNDGIPDIVEVGFGQLSGGKATMDLDALGPWADANGNGLHNSIDPFVAGFNIISTDGDGILDQFDLDSDNDGLFDVDEAGYGDGDVNGDGMGDGGESDNDGILDIFDFFVGFGNLGQPLPINSDGDTFVSTLGSIPLYDYMEVDSDNDGVFDLANELHSALDANNDGIIDGSIDLDRDGILDAFDTSTLVFGSPRDLNEPLYIEFDGRNDYMEDAAVITGPDVTLMAWVKLDPANNGGAIFYQNNIKLIITASKEVRATVGGVSVTSAVQNSARWIHLAATYEGATNLLKLYLNGTFLGQATGAGLGAASPLLVGKDNTTVSNPKYFKGSIDEARVFNVALTTAQIQKMVYQELFINGSNLQGTIIPIDIPGLTAANLIRYYRMDTYKDDIADDLTTPTVDLGTGAKIFNVKTIRRQTAPMPFITKQSGSLGVAVDDATNGVLGTDATANDWSIVDARHDINMTASDGDLGLIVRPGITITVDNDSELKNDWYLKLDGSIDLLGESQLVQTDISQLDVTSAGSIKRRQQGTADKYTYNYFSMPVSQMSTASNNLGNALSGMLKTAAGNVQYSFTINPPSPQTTPVTMASRWFYIFDNQGEGDITNWAQVAPTDNVKAGLGFTMKGPGTGAVSDLYEYIFEGKPNSGDISVVVTTGNQVLVGNPYSSALDANKFIDDNIGISSPANNSINGTLYFWEHFGGGSHLLKEYEGGYASYTKSGGVLALQHPDLYNPLSPGGSKEPTQYIPVGQGFFVTADADGGNVVFKNSQRTFATEGSGSSVFTKAPDGRKITALGLGTQATQSQTAQTVVENPNEPLVRKAGQQAVADTLSRVWLNFTTPTGFRRQVLVAYTDKATAGEDPGYDALLIDKGPNDLYWKINDKDYVIQAVPPFDEQTVIPMETTITNPGQVKIEIDKAENILDNQPVYLRVWNGTTFTYHNLKDGSFTENLAAGVFADRYQITFGNNETLSTDDNSLPDDGRILFVNNTNELIINNPKGEMIGTVSGYNMLGQLVYQTEVGTTQSAVSLQVSLTRGVYIFNIEIENQQIAKKIIKN